MNDHINKCGNILLVANWDSDVGYAWWLMENFWETIANHFSLSGADSYLVYPKITTIPDSIASTKIIPLELNFFDHSILNLLKIRHLIRKHSIRNIYLSDSPSYSFYYLLFRLFGVRKIVVHDHTPGERTKPKYLRKLLKGLIQRIPLFTADHFIAVTEFVHKRHLEVNLIPSRKCSVAANGIYPYLLEKTSSEYVHHEFNIPSGVQVIVTTGRASYYKGIDFFIECANELVNKQNLTQIHFLFCGDGPDLDDFKTLCAKYALSEYFTFAGKRTDIKDILPSCSIALHAACGEVGYSLSILEYMSAGLITIVPDNPSTSLSIEHMKDGILYKPHDIFSATEAIKKSLDNIFTEDIRSNAINSVTTKFNINNTNKQLIDILDRVFKK